MYVTKSLILCKDQIHNVRRKINECIPQSNYEFLRLVYLVDESWQRWYRCALAGGHVHEDILLRGLVFELDKPK